MRTGTDFLAALDDGRQVYLDGAVVPDVANHPAFRGAARSLAAMYDTAADPDQRDLYTYPSPADGAPVHRWWQTPRSRADLAARRRASEAWAATNFGFLGRSPDHVASFFAGFAGSLPLFASGGAGFADNVQRFYERARDESLYLSYAIIHPTIDRARAPHEQYAPNVYVSVVGERDGGIVLRGAQMLGTGSVLSDFVFVSCILPLPPGSEDYAISVVVPNAAPGLRIYSRRPYAVGNGEADYPLSARFDETDSLLVFDDVLVPWEHVFAYRSIEVTSGQFQRTAAHSLGNTQAQVRFATKLRFLAGLARRVAEGNGSIDDRRTVLRLGELAARCQLPQSFLEAAEATSWTDEYGVENPGHDSLYAAMTLQPRLMDEVLYTLREMTGGAVIQLPSSAASFADPVSAADIDRYVRWPHLDAAGRVRLLKLVWDAVGSEFAGRHQQYEMFYAGDPSVVQARSYRSFRWASSAEMVDRCLATGPEPAATDAAIDATAAAPGPPTGAAPAAGAADAPTSDRPAAPGSGAPAPARSSLDVHA